MSRDRRSTGARCCTGCERHRGRGARRGPVRFAGAADALSAACLAPGLMLLGGAGGNILVLATDAGKVVVDGGAAASSEAVRQKLDELPGGRVVALFDTHWHLDQVGANEVLGGAGATIYAHAKTRQRLTSGYYLPTEDRYQPPSRRRAGRPRRSTRRRRRSSAKRKSSTVICSRRIRTGTFMFSSPM